MSLNMNNSWLPDSTSASMEMLTFFHNYTMAIMMSIMMLILFSMTFICVSSLYSYSVIQNHSLEMAWTLTPVLLLLMIALPSLKTLYKLEPNYSNLDMFLKVMGHQWYWSYNILNSSIDCYMTPVSMLNKDEFRLLETDDWPIVPSYAKIHVIVSSSDVIHSWSLPSLGLKLDAIPGHLNQTEVYAKTSGLFYGQCSEICGVNHSFMPIKIEFMSIKYFLWWIQKHPI